MARLLRYLIAFATSSAPGVQDALADVLVFEPDRDNTLYETVDGSLSNGAGERLFAGMTASNALRRSVLRFDLSAIPPGSFVTKVTLNMNVSKAPPNAPASTLELRRVLSDWGEGTSDASGEEGGGAPSAPGDATWIHRFHTSDLWAVAGGDYSNQVSATTVAPGVTGPIFWKSAGLAADVQGWIDDPASNFGWLIRAEDEANPGNAKRFDSRENGNIATRPRLTVEFDSVPRFDAPVVDCNPLVYCTANPANAAGIEVSSCDCAAPSIWIDLVGGAPGEFGYLLTGKGVTPISDPPGASGDLCLGGSAIGRFTADLGTIDSAGTLSTDILNAQTGGGGGGVPNVGGNFCSPPGQTWSFQYWYRQQGSSRFSRAVRVTFQ